MLPASVYYSSAAGKRFVKNQESFRVIPDSCDRIAGYVKSTTNIEWMEVLTCLFVRKTNLPREEETEGEQTGK